MKRLSFLKRLIAIPAAIVATKKVIKESPYDHKKEPMVIKSNKESESLKSLVYRGGITGWTP